MTNEKTFILRISSLHLLKFLLLNFLLEIALSESDEKYRDS